MPGIFAASFGLLLGVALLKFVNPSIMEKYVDRPADVYQWMFFPWPIGIAHWLLAIVAALGLAAAGWKVRVPRLLAALPLCWLIWQCLSATQTVNARITTETLEHFLCCSVCFYLGLFCLTRVQKLWLFWIGLIGGFVLVLVSGLEQHFGGLKDTQNYFFQNIYPKLGEVPPEFLKKMTSNRIFATQFYPNALAGVILLLLPVWVAFAWSIRGVFTIGARRFLAIAVGVPALACLYWSGSKGGWLLMLFVGLVAAMFLPIRRQVKVILISLALVAGLAGFGLKYAGFFEKGATSVVARFDYWRAALRITGERPVFGSGPGTFGVLYQQLKKPESEMAHLTHNDYLEQASDSGVPGFLAYCGFIVGSLVYSVRRGRLRNQPLQLGVWLGVLGWCLQGLMEFGLYLPDSSWAAFALLGWLLGRSSNRIDSDPAAG